MALRIDHEHPISASAEIVWQVLTDLPSYGEWNPFVVAASSSLVVGEPIDMKVRVLSFMTQSQRETISHYEPGRSYCYGLARNRVGALHSERCHVVQPTGPDGCTYVSRFELAGWLSPLVSLLLGRSLRRGFTAMSAAVKERAESLAHGAR
jgi:hypothetical protein